MRDLKPELLYNIKAWPTLHILLLKTQSKLIILKAPQCMSQMVSDFFSHYFGKMRNEKKEIPTGTILRVCKNKC